MKDYTQNYEESKRFIEEYNIVGDKIVNNLASGEKYSIPNNEINEHKVLTKMEDQAKNLGTIEKRFEKYLRKNVWLTISEMFCIGVNIITLKSPSFPVEWVPVSLGVVGFVALGTISTIWQCIDAKIKLNDVQKSKIFMGYKDSLNKHISSQNKNILLGISKKLCIKIDHSIATTDKPVLDINFIGKEVTLRDLKIIKDNIERYREFGFIEESNPENTENKGNARVYKSR